MIFTLIGLIIIIILAYIYFSSYKYNYDDNIDDEYKTLEVGKGVSQRLLKPLQDLKDKCYKEQTLEQDPEKKDKILRNFMNVTNMIQILEEWQPQESK